MVSRMLWVLIASLIAGCGDVLPPSSRGVCITGYNQHERQIYEFWLDNENKAGCHGNPPAPQPGDIYGGGGGFACGCRVTPGKEVSLMWEFVQSPADFDAKLPAEEHTVMVTVPYPEPSTNPEYLRVYFMRNGTAQLQWDEDMGTPELVPPADEELVK